MKDVVELYRRQQHRDEMAIALHANNQWLWSPSIMRKGGRVAKRKEEERREEEKKKKKGGKESPHCRRSRGPRGRRRIRPFRPRRRPDGPL